MSGLALIVIAKEPVAGRVKTRLSPPCTPVEAAALAAAALADTLAAVARTPAARRVVVLDGRPGAWIPEGFDVIAQAEGGLDHRLAAAFAEVGGPALLVGMDTPQLSPALLERAAGALLEPGTQAVLGEAEDGGYWAIGLREPRRAVFEGVPMSRSSTARLQRARLRRLGLTLRELPRLRDIDTIADARAVATAHPGLGFSRALEALGRAREAA